MKGITPVIAIILMLLVTISLTAFVAVFFQQAVAMQGGQAQSATEAQVDIQGQKIDFVAAGEGSLVVKSVGTSPVTQVSVLVGGQPVSASLGGSVAPGAVGTIAVSNIELASLPDGEVTIAAPGNTITVTNPLPAPEAYWTFDSVSDGRVIKDSTGNYNALFMGATNDGTLGDGTCTEGSGKCPASTAGKYGNAMKFDGSNDYIAVPHSGTLAFTDQVTVEAWLRQDDASTVWKRPVQKYTTAGNVPPFSITKQAGWGCEFLDSAGTQYKQLFDSVTVTPGVWYHVACVGSKSGNYFRLYVNGGLRQSTAWFPSGNNLRVIGTDFVLGKGYGENTPFNGAIDEVRAYGRALSEQEIKDSMASRYPLSGAALSISMESIFPFAGKIMANDTHFIAAGKHSGALNLNGVNEYAIVKSAVLDIPSANGWSITSWAYSDRMTTMTGMVTATVTSSANFAYFGVRNGDLLWRVDKAGNTMRRERTTDAPLSNNAWHRIALTKSGNSDVVAYASGIADATRASQGSDSVPAVAGQTLIGRIITGDVSLHFGGMLDDMRIFKQVIS